MSELDFLPLPEKQFIKLYGLFGHFSTPNSKYRVRFFSTYASNEPKGLGPHQLLKELKPVRERVDSAQIHDMSSLMQRDLNDSRVANELVPYLLGLKENSTIAFFPAILAVLMPKDKLYDSLSIEYPKAVIDGANTNYSINDEVLWRTIKGNPDIPLGILEVSPDFVDIIVIDGQHRSNAFRVVTDEFFTDQKSKIYAPFYSSVTEKIKKSGKFDANLPVTLIWFEPVEQNDEDVKIDPKIVSRRLFVDVNNNAKKINNSRNILLDDYDPAKYFTRSIYSYLASEINNPDSLGAFEPSTFSLLHAGFDVDDDLQNSRPHVFTLTIPEILKTAMDRVFFSTWYHAKADVLEVQRMSKKKYLNVAKSLLPITGLFLSYRNNLDAEVFFKFDEASDKITEINGEINLGVSIPVSLFYSKFILLASHYSACDEIFSGKGYEGDYLRAQILKEVFAGGEGLFYSYQNVPKSGDNAEVRSYRQVIDGIQKSFLLVRERIINSGLESGVVEGDRIRQAFDTFRTKAFQTGVFMSFWTCYFTQVENGELSAEAAMLDFLELINKPKTLGWIAILTEYSPRFTNALDPKKWPAFQSIINKVLREDDFGSPNIKNPDWVVFKSILKERTSTWLRNVGLEEKDIGVIPIDEERQKLLVEESISIFLAIQERCLFKENPEIDYQAISETIFIAKPADVDSVGQVAVDFDEDDETEDE